MIKIFVTEILETLQPQELEALSYFLESPYFNRGHNRDSLIQLFDFLKIAVQNNAITKLERSEIFVSIYPGKPYVDSKVDKLISELKGLIETFLSVQQYLSPENQPNQSLDLTRAIRLKGMETRYHQSLEKIKKQSISKIEESTDGHLFLYFTAIEEHEWQSQYNKAKGDLNIPDVLKHLDNYYFVQKIEMRNRLLLQRRVTILPTRAQEIIDKSWDVPPDALGESALIDLTWEIHLLLREDTPKVEGFFRLLSFLQNKEKELNPSTLAQFYTYLRNICITLINTGLSEFYKVLHSIHKDNLNRGYFYFENKVKPSAYLNITIIALIVKDIEWANNFVEDHKTSIVDENESHDFFKLNKALCLFTEKRYEEALEIIPFGSSYSFYHLTARNLELKIYYEMDSELLPYKIDAFKMFISRAGNKVLSESFQEPFVNFINFLRQLSLSHKSRDKARSDQLIKRINEKKLVAERTWLLEKARELGERKK